MGLTGGGPNKIQLKKKTHVVQEKLDFHGRTKDLMAWYTKNQTMEPSKAVWNENVQFFDSKTNKTTWKTANELFAAALVEPDTDVEICKMLAIVRSAHICHRLDLYNLLCTFLLEFVFYNESYNCLVDFCFGYR